MNQLPQIAEASNWPVLERNKILHLFASGIMGIMLALGTLFHGMFDRPQASDLGRLRCTSFGIYNNQSPILRLDIPGATFCKRSMEIIAETVAELPEVTILLGYVLYMINMIHPLKSSPPLLHPYPCSVA